MAVLAATVLGVVFLPDALKSPKGTSNKPELAMPSSPQNKPSDAPKLATNPSSKAAKEGDVQVDVDRIAAADPVGPAIAPSVHNAPSPSSVKASASNLASNAKKDAEIVRVIDDQLSYLWQRVGVKAAPEVPMEAWLDRIAMAVLARPATAAEKEAFRSNKNDNKASDFVDGLVSSGEFARVWSSRLAEHYLGKRMRGSRDVPSPENNFIAWLEQSVGQRSFIGDFGKKIGFGQ